MSNDREKRPGRIFLSLDIKRNWYKSREEECLYSSALMLPFLQRNVDISLAMNVGV